MPPLVNNATLRKDLSAVKMELAFATIAEPGSSRRRRQTAANRAELRHSQREGQTPAHLARRLGLILLLGRRAASLPELGADRAAIEQDW